MSINASQRFPKSNLNNRHLPRREFKHGSIFQNYGSKDAIVLGIPEEKYIAQVRNCEAKGNDADKRHNTSDEFDRVQFMVAEYSKHGMIVCHDKLPPILAPRITWKMKGLCSKRLYQLIRFGIFVRVSIGLSTRWPKEAAALLFFFHFVWIRRHAFSVISFHQFLQWWWSSWYRG